MNRLITLSLMLGMLFISACSSSSSTTKFIPQVTQQDKARVIFYRPGTMSNALYSPQLFINDSPASTLKNKKLLSISLTPGKHDFDIDKENEYLGDNKLQLTAVAGETYYIRLDTSLKLSASTTYKPYERTFTLKQISADTAIDEISSCCTEKVSINATTDNDDIKQQQEVSPGFSVDKTQNPFSH